MITGKSSSEANHHFQVRFVNLPVAGNLYAENRYDFPQKLLIQKTHKTCCFRNRVNRLLRNSASRKWILIWGQQIASWKKINKYLFGVPPPRMPVGNEGLAWKSPTKNIVILVVTGILGTGTSQEISLKKMLMSWTSCVIQSIRLDFPNSKIAPFLLFPPKWRFVRLLLLHSKKRTATKKDTVQFLDLYIYIYFFQNCLSEVSFSKIWQQ